MHIATKKSSQINISSEKKLEEFAKNLALNIKKGEIFFLYGEMGVGKTTFVKHLINKLQLKFDNKTTEVTSPTFNIMNEYKINDLIIKHYDLYRIKESKELNHLGIFSDDLDTIKIIEWPGLIKTLFEDKLEIYLNYATSENEREIKMIGFGKWKNFENEF